MPPVEAVANSLDRGADDRTKLGVALEMITLVAFIQSQPYACQSQLSYLFSDLRKAPPWRCLLQLLSGLMLTESRGSGAPQVAASRGIRRSVRRPTIVT